ncbi:MAG: cobalamin-dependent protein, partial [Candidatus Aenigmatarchaeota archaeon]
MKVALVYPRIKDRDLTPPLGLLYLASYAKEYGSTSEIKIFDNNFDNIEESVVKFNPDIIGITAMTIDYMETIRLATFFKEKLDIPIIIGGIHISSVPESLAKPFDIGVVGEGEATFLEVLLLFEKKGKFETNELQKIKGIAFHANGK